MDEQFSTDPRTEEEALTPTPETEPAGATEPSPLAEETPAAEEASDTLEAEESDMDEPDGDGTDEEDDPLAGAFEYYAAEPPKKKTWPIILLAVLLVAVFVGGLLWAFGVFNKTDTTDGDDPAGDSTSQTGDGIGTKDVSDLIAAESANFQVTNGMFAFNMESTYQSFQSQYSYYLSSFGLDPSVSTKTQTLYTGEGTWFDYFKGLAKNDAEWMLMFSEAAKKDGVTLDDATAAQIESYVESVDFSTFHNGVTADDARAFLQMYYTALLHENALYAAMTYSADEVQAAYDADPTAYTLCDYAYVTLSIGEEGQFATAAEAADTVATLTAADTAEEFRRAVIAYLMTTGNYETEEEAAADYDANAVVSGAAYTADDGISDWLFAADTTVGTTKTVETNGSITVYMLTKAPARDTTKTVNVRHILLTAGTYGSDDEAKTKADAVLAEWNAGAATADSFGELAAQYTEDSNGAAGGLYSGVTEGQMVTEFNDWCFDETRTPGDTDVVQTSYGYHVMYFEGVQEAWYGAVVNTLKNEAYQQVYEEYQTTYPVTFHDDSRDQNDM